MGYRALLQEIYTSVTDGDSVCFQKELDTNTYDSTVSLAAHALYMILFLWGNKLNSSEHQAATKCQPLRLKNETNAKNCSSLNGHLRLAPKASQSP